MKRWVRYIPFLVLACFLAAAFIYQERLSARVEIGQPAPEFTLERLDGGEFEFGLPVDKPVVINFWTTWCTECRDEMPLLQSFHEQYGSDIAVIGVNMREPEAVIRPFVQQYGVTYPIVLDRFERVKRTYRVTGVPETWFIDREGNAVFRHIGPITEEELSHIARQLLGGQSMGAVH